MTFRQEITSELACINQCRSLERGACVSAEGNCVFTTRESCDQQTQPVVNVTGPLIGFHPDRLCSNPQLGTECAPQQRTGCVPGKEEVYWFDSCGNPENIYDSDKVRSSNNGFVLAKAQSCNPGSNNVNNVNCGNCDFSQGSLCGPFGTTTQKPVFGDFICQDLSCGQEDVTKDPNSPASNTPKKLGESWCAYDSVPGFGQDPVGSRHFRRICINGKELTEPCKDFREEICVQGLQGKAPLDTIASFQIGSGGFFNAGCRINRWEGCNEIKDQYNCENIEQRDCYWVGKQADTEDAKRENRNGFCAPLVPPGLKFWTDESVGQTPKADAAAVCEKQNTECKVTYEEPGIGLIGGKRRCIKNCHCESKQWLLAMNTLCVSQGDCGAWVNFKGKGTPDGFKVSPNHKYRITNADITAFGEIVKVKKNDPRYGGFGVFFQRTWVPIAFSIGLGIATELTTHAGDAGFLSGATSNIFYPKFFRPTDAAINSFGYTAGTAAQQLTGTIAAGQAGISQTSMQAAIASQGWKPAVESGVNVIKNAAGDQILFRSGGVDGTWTAVSPVELSGAAKLEASVATQTPAISPIFTWINTFMLLWTLYNIFDFLLADTDDETFSIECNPWVAPRGGSDCEQCGADGKECSEYRCKSLGQLCKLVNPGTTKELCINAHPNDVSPPIIKAALDVLQPGFTLTESADQGYSVSPLIEPFTAVTLGIKTNEPAQCKYSLNAGTNFDQMTQFFGEGLYDYNSTVTFSLPSQLAKDPQVLQLTNGGQYTLYIRCQDGNGNKNEKDYYIKFGIRKGPDLTAPVIELTSITNDAFIPATVNTTQLTIYVNEPSECRWSDIDDDFGNMQHTFSCSTQQQPTSSLYYGLFDCTTILDNIEQNKINTWYFKCKDQPGAPEADRNVNEESFIFRLRGTLPLDITSVLPQTGSQLFDPSPTLSVVTSRGAEAGVAVCGYNFETNEPGQTITFVRTNATVHEQPFTNLTSGQYTAYISCFDVAYNLAQAQTTFTLSVDAGAPQVAQIYTQGTILIVVMNEVSTCEYSTTGAFTYGTGVQMTGVNTEEHQASLDSQIYYITCEDRFGNRGSFTIYV